MTKPVIDLSGNTVVADKFSGEIEGPFEVDAADVEVPAVTVGGVTVGPGSLIEVLEDLITLINTKADA
jgi:hypothetical protein